VKLPNFIKQIDELVLKWNNPDSLTPRAELEAIYKEVRNSTAHELAVMQEKLDRALRLYHKKLMLEGSDALRETYNPKSDIASIIEPPKKEEKTE
jgi:hypothetical protein